MTPETKDRLVALIRQHKGQAEAERGNAAQFAGRADEPGRSAWVRHRERQSFHDGVVYELESIVAQMDETPAPAEKSDVCNNCGGTGTVWMSHDFQGNGHPYAKPMGCACGAGKTVTTTGIVTSVNSFDGKPFAAPADSRATEPQHTCTSQISRLMTAQKLAQQRRDAADLAMVEKLIVDEPPAQRGAERDAALARLEQTWREEVPGQQREYCEGYDAGRSDCADELAALRARGEK